MKLHRYARAAGMAVLAALGVFLSPGTWAQGWQPTRNVELVIPAGAGGSLDTTGRFFEKVWQELHLVPVPTSVVNRSGGGHAVGLAYMNSKAHDASVISVTSPTLLTNYINGRLPYTYTHFTPLATMSADYIAIVVKADSPIKSAKQLIAMLRKNPESLSIGLSSALGGTHELALAMPLEAAGINVKKLKMVSFNSSSPAITALLGGHLDVISTSSSLVTPHIADGSLRAIAVSSPHRLPGALADTPTWPEMGMKGVFSNWRGLLGTPGITKAQIAFWDHVLKSVAMSKQFKDFADKNNWQVAYRNHAQSVAFMRKSYKELHGLMKSLGFAKR